MNFLDVRTVMFSHLATTSICALVIIFLWLQNRERYSGTFYWVLDYLFQTTAVLLIILRGSIPVWISIVLANSLVIAGALLGLMGQERFVSRISRQGFNYFLLGIFIAVHTYFTFVVPDLKWRNINIAVGMLIFCFQCSWLVFYRVPSASDLRRITRGVGVVFGLFSLVNLIRIAVTLFTPYPDNDFFKSGLFDTLFILSYQLLLILLAYNLTLMFNQRLLMDIRFQEEKFTKAFHSSPYAVMLTRLIDGHISEVNNGFLNISGYQRAEVIGKTTLELHIWAREEDRLSLIKAMSESGRVQEREFLFQMKSGDLLIGLLSAEMILINQEPFILASIMDITDRKQAEEALRRSERLLNDAQRISKVGGWDYDVKNKLTTWTEGVYRIYGVEKDYDPNNIQRDISFYSDEDQIMIEQAFWKAVNTGEAYDLEARFNSADGKQKQIRTIGTPVFLNGKVTRVFGNIMDITERKEAEAAYKESEERYRQVVENANEAIFVVQDETIIFNNPKTMEISGFSAKELSATSFTAFIHPEDRGLVLDRYQRRLKGEHLPQIYDFRIVDKQGNIKWGELNAVLFSWMGRPATLNFLNDITERKEMEDQLQKMSTLDDLTGLYNRRGFLTLSQQQLKVAERTKKEMLLFFADLDNMKWINDTLGHQEGDHALIEISKILKETFRESDIIGRMGGDEFAVLALSIAEINPDAITSRLQNSIKNFNQKRTRSFQLALSIGISRYHPDNPSSIDQLLAEADRLMYAQKRNRSVFPGY